jgi:hypothetical protein
VRGGTTKPISSRKGKQELKQTAGGGAPSALRAVASSHASSDPSRAMAEVTAE